MFTPKSVYLIDPGLKNIGGHNIQMDRLLAQECSKRGIPVELYGCIGASQNMPDMPVNEVFQLDIFAEARPQNQNFVVFETYFLVNRIFFDDMKKISTTEFTPDDLVFFPNLTQNQIEGVADWLSKLPAENKPNVAIMLRYLGSHMAYNKSRGYGPAIDLLYCNALQKLNERHSKTYLFSDTEVLAAYYSRLTGRPVTKLPNPQIEPRADSVNASTSVTSTSHDQSALSVVFVGGWAQVHGSEYLPEIVSSLMDVQGVNFKIQVSIKETDTPSAKAMVAVSEAHPERVSILQGSLDYDTYWDTLNAADLVLILYQQENYSFASSGVFTEAAALGKVIVTTAKTTMETSIRNYGLGAAIAAEFTLESCVSTLRSAISNYAELNQTAKASAINYSRENSPKGFLDHMFAHISEHP